MAGKPPSEAADHMAPKRMVDGRAIRNPHHRGVYLEFLGGLGYGLRALCDTVQMGISSTPKEPRIRRGGRKREPGIVARSGGFATDEKPRPLVHEQPVDPALPQTACSAGGLPEKPAAGATDGNQGRDRV